MVDLNRVVVISSFSEKGFTQYGKKFIESFDANWPKQVRLTGFFHNEFETPDKVWIPEVVSDTGRLSLVRLDNVPELNPFKQNVANLLQQMVGIPYTSKKIPWRMDAVKFCNKVFAIANANAEHFPKKDCDWLIWLDADTYCKQPIPEEKLTSWLDTDADIVYLGREGVADYSETSFVAFNVSKMPAVLFIQDMINTYLTGEFRFYAEWHDGFIFDRLLNLSKAHGLITKNLSVGVPDLSAFMFSELGTYMEHLKGNLKDAPIAPNKQLNTVGMAPYKVNPVDSVVSAELANNIFTNLETLDKYITHCKPQEGKRAIFVSGGPSAKANMEKIKKDYEEGATVFCVKHSYPTLLANGVVPKFCVIIDPRPLDGTSTHGVVRKDLFQTIHPETVFLTATMTHPSVVNHLKERGAKVVGWHATSKEAQAVLSAMDPSLSAYTISLPLGSCSAVRGLSLISVFGFKDVTLYGYDCSLAEGHNSQKEVLTVGLTDGNLQVNIVQDVEKAKQSDIGKKTKFFDTTGELVALYQDLMTCIPMLTTQGILNITVEAPEATLFGYGWMMYLKHLEATKKAEEAMKANSLDYNEFLKLETTPKLSVPEDVKKKILDSMV